ncbi:TMV resistance protein N [Tanacetum coccineum]
MSDHIPIEIQSEIIKRLPNLKKLRILDLNCSHSLIKTGDFSGLENLEEMSFRGCNKLEELHSSIGCLHKLAILNLGSCTRLKRFPWEMLSKLLSLRKLFLSRCENIGLELEEVSVPFMSSLRICPLKVLELSECNVLEISANVGSLRWLKQLDLSYNRFSSLPESIEQLHELKTMLFSNCYNMHSIPNLPPNLKFIRASYCKNLVNLPSNISDLNFLRELDLSECYLLGSAAHDCFRKLTQIRSLCILKMRNCNVSEVSSEIGSMVSLTNLDLSGNTFSSLPDTISNLLELHELNINHCTKLELLPLLPSNLRKIQAFKCCSLEVIPFDPITANYSLRTKVGKDSPLTEPLQIYLSGDEIPDWCNYRHNGDILSFEAPTHLDKKILGFIIHATTQQHYHSSPYITPKILNKTNQKSHHFRRMELGSISTCIIFYPLDDTTLVVKAGDTAVLQFRDEYVPKRVTSYGLSLVYEGDEMDSKLVIEPTRLILSELTTSMTELCDSSFQSDDEV